MEIARPFIRLPYAFDAERLAEETAALPAGAWMAHPAGFRGNSAVPLVSRGGGINEDFHGRMRETPWLETCPYLRQVLGAFDEVLGRTRLMKLAAGAEVSPHVDFNYHWYTRVRVHVPVVTNADVRFRCGEEVVHMRPGECWIFDSWRRHRVDNGGREDRVHLVIDLAGSSRFWATVRRMQTFDPFADREEIDALVTFLPFEPGREAALVTEQFNVAPVMAPGEVDGLVRELVADFSANPANDPALVARYRELLVDFGKDWREIWHLYGSRQEGWPRYHAAIEALRSRLHPDNRALKTASNDVGVNPVIVQRILRAALVTDVADDFP